MISSNTSSSWLTSCLFAPVTTIDNGTPRPSTNRCRLLPFFSPICWVVANSLSGKRRFDHGAVYTLPAPGYALHFVVFSKACPPEGNEESSPHPMHKMSMDGAGASETFFGQSLPLAACTENIKYSSKYFSGRHRLSASSGFAHIGLFRISFRFGYEFFNSFP